MMSLRPASKAAMPTTAGSIVTIRDPTHHYENYLHWHCAGCELAMADSTAPHVWRILRSLFYRQLCPSRWRQGRELCLHDLEFYFLTKSYYERTHPYGDYAASKTRLRSRISGGA